MRRCPLIIATVVASCITFTSGCCYYAACTQVKFRAPFTEGDASAKIEVIRSAPKTRAEVHEVLGQPWIASDRWRVEVYRLTGKQRQMIWLFVPYPIPLPDFSDTLAVYTLVTYSETGMVEAVDAVFDAVYAIEAGHKAFLSAGDHYFSHEGYGYAYDALMVSRDRFLRDYAADSARHCTVMVACSPDGPCFSRVSVDDGRSLEFLPFRVKIHRTEAVDAAVKPVITVTSSAEEKGVDSPAAQNAEVSKIPFFPLVPIVLPYGAHHLRFTSKWLEGEIKADMSCSTPGVIYAVQVSRRIKEFSYWEQLLSGMRTAVAEGSVTFQPEVPQPNADQPVLLYFNGTWFDPATSVQAVR